MHGAETLELSEDTKRELCGVGVGRRAVEFSAEVAGVGHVEGGRVELDEASSVQWIQWYLPRHECLTTKYLARYSGSSVTAEEEEATGHDLLPLQSCIFSDHLTLVLAYRSLVKEDDRKALRFELTGTAGIGRRWSST